MQLNSGQEIAVSAAIKAMETKSSLGYTIVGEGGTGKTYSVMAYLAWAQEKGFKVLMTAPTNKAVKQLEKAARAAGLDTSRIHFKTLHSALGLSLLPTAERKYATRVRESILSEFDIIVIDEGSMLGSYLLSHHLVPELKMYNLFSVIMGDNMQLPPVRETCSQAFDLFPVSELTQNQRQLSNPDGTPNGILQVTAKLRQCIKQDKPFAFHEVPAHNVTLVRDADFLKMVVQQFDLTTDLEEVRVMAWRNRRVDAINEAIRTKVYGKGAARFEIGERVITGSPVRDSDNQMILSTDEECIVAAVQDSTVTDEETGDEWETTMLVLNPCYADEDQVILHVLHTNEKERYDRYLAKLKKKAEEAAPNLKGIMWRRFHEFTELFSDIKYCYCITVHRSQGSTYKRAIVDVKDILDNPSRTERQRLIYVAFSRPQQELLINKVNFTA